MGLAHRVSIAGGTESNPAQLSLLLAPNICRPISGAYMSIHHQEDLKKIRPLIGFIIENFPQIFTKDLKSIATLDLPSSTASAKQSKLMRVDDSPKAKVQDELESDSLMARRQFRPQAASKQPQLKIAIEGDTESIGEFQMHGAGGGKGTKSTPFNSTLATNLSFQDEVSDEGTVPMHEAPRSPTHSPSSFPPINFQSWEWKVSENISLVHNIFYCSTEQPTFIMPVFAFVAFSYC